ncbi:hypothetical protein Nepgr_026673 [Nepenthes gracilis]|uniref:Uncharacterized protein n=1 Tax=Nepenthes gracilis TaxID=150966 RepID=A0AAD3T7B3_NEPGR|nr:hypothetical protein Nepgr_026673 [Nepenthes gracilis]
MDPGYLASTSRTSKANQESNTSTRNILTSTKKKEEDRHMISSLHSKAIPNICNKSVGIKSIVLQRTKVGFPSKQPSGYHYYTAKTNQDRNERLAEEVGTCNTHPTTTFDNSVSITIGKTMTAAEKGFTAPPTSESALYCKFRTNLHSTIYSTIKTIRSQFPNMLRSAAGQYGQQGAATAKSKTALASRASSFSNSRCDFHENTHPKLPLLRQPCINHNRQHCDRSREGFTAPPTSVSALYSKIRTNLQPTIHSTIKNNRSQFQRQL